MVKQRFIKKPDVEWEDMSYMSAKLLIAFGWLNLFAEQRGLGPVKITNIIRKFPQSVSDTHPEGRALDFSIRGWTQEDIETIELQMRLQCEELAAISKQTGEPRLILFHNVGLGPHGHLQVSK